MFTNYKDYPELQNLFARQPEASAPLVAPLEAALQRIGKIFVNYRRDDEWSAARLLQVELEKALGADRVFMDVAGISQGDNFVNAINRELEASDIVCVVIGKQWEAELLKRASLPQDFVVHEVELAILANKLIIPVLVGGARIPPADVLPEKIRSLSLRHAQLLHRDSFPADCARFAEALKTKLDAIAVERATKVEADRLLAERERQRMILEVQAQQRQAEEAARLHALANLSPGDIRKLEEHQHWEFVRPRNRSDELRAHLERYPSGETARFAYAALEALEWTRLGSNPGFHELQKFLDAFPNGEHANTALAKQQAILRERAAEDRRREERERWQIVSSANKIEEIRAHLAQYPSGVTAPEAAQALEAAVWRSLGEPRTIREVKNFLAEFPAGKLTEHAQAVEKRLLDAEARKSPGQRALEQAEAEKQNFSYQEFIDAFSEKPPRVELERLYREAGREPLTFSVMAGTLFIGVLLAGLLLTCLAKIVNLIPETLLSALVGIVRGYTIDADNGTVKVAIILGLVTSVLCSIYWKFSDEIIAMHEGAERHDQRVALSGWALVASGFLWVFGCLVPFLAVFLIVIPVVGALFVVNLIIPTLTYEQYHAIFPYGWDFSNRKEQLAMAVFLSMFAVATLATLVYRGNGWHSLWQLPFAMIGVVLSIYVAIWYIIFWPVMVAAHLRYKYT